MASDRRSLSGEDQEELRILLCQMQIAIQRQVLAVRDASSNLDELSQVVAVTEADTIYRIDRVGEEAIVAWMDENWPRKWPTSLVMEGLEERVVLPSAAADREPVLSCIVDPIDGTRSLMVDKRSAWVLAAVAPYNNGAARLGEIEVAAMTELPPSKQRLADQLSAVRGGGRGGLRAVRRDVDSGREERFTLRPSGARDLLHGFASFARFFPAGKALTAELDEQLFERLYGDRADWQSTALVFDDQYISTGGQFYELLAGHDRMLGDLRPLVYAKLGMERAICCHPYDACAALLLEEAGCPVMAPDGGPLDAPFDTTSAVAWIGFANRDLHEHVWPQLQGLLRSTFER